MDDGSTRTWKRHFEYIGRTGLQTRPLSLNLLDQLIVPGDTTVSPHPWPFRRRTSPWGRQIVPQWNGGSRAIRLTVAGPLGCERRQFPGSGPAKKLALRDGLRYRNSIAHDFAIGAGAIALCKRLNSASSQLSSFRSSAVLFASRYWRSSCVKSLLVRMNTGTSAV